MTVNSTLLGWDPDRDNPFDILSYAFPLLVPTPGIGRSSNTTVLYPSQLCTGMTVVMCHQQRDKEYNDSDENNVGKFDDAEDDNSFNYLAFIDHDHTFEDIFDDAKDDKFRNYYRMEEERKKMEEERQEEEERKKMEEEQNRQKLEQEEYRQRTQQIMNIIVGNLQQ